MREHELAGAFQGRDLGEISRGEEIIRVSGRVLDWPLVCACCGESVEPQQGVHQVARGTESSMRLLMDNWPGPPLCAACAEHTSLASSADEWKKQGERLFEMLLTFSPLLAVSAILVFWFASGSGNLGFWAGIVAGFVAVIYSFKQKADKTKRSQIVLQEAVEKMHDNCSAVRVPVEMEESSGFNYTFLFRSSSYATIFSQANADEINVH